MGTHRGIWVWWVQILHLILDRTVPAPCFWHFLFEKGQNKAKMANHVLKNVFPSHSWRVFSKGVWPERSLSRKLATDFGVVDIGVEGEIQYKSVFLFKTYKKQEDLYQKFLTDDGFAGTG